MTGFVPMHPEPGPDAQTLRWIVPVGALPVIGAIATAPAALGVLLRTGVVQALEAETQAVVVRLAEGRDWAEEGARVRDALAAALLLPLDWRPAVAATEDDLLRATLQDVLAGSAGEFIRSHGGEVVIVSVADGRVAVRMAGACAHCPALAFTLHGRLESELRRRFPALIEVREASGRELRARLDRPARQTGWSRRRSA